MFPESKSGGICQRHFKIWTQPEILDLYLWQPNVSVCALSHLCLCFLLFLPSLLQCNQENFNIQRQLGYTHHTKTLVVLQLVALMSVEGCQYYRGVTVLTAAASLRAYQIGITLTSLCYCADACISIFFVAPTSSNRTVIISCYTPLELHACHACNFLKLGA